MISKPLVLAPPRPPPAPVTYGNLAITLPDQACRENSAADYSCPAGSLPQPSPSKPHPAERGNRSHARVASKPALTQVDPTSESSRSSSTPREMAVRRADSLAVNLRAALLSITIPLSRVAHAMVREKIWFSCGFARAEDFARERLGRSRRWLGDLAALNRAMESLPSLVSALTGADGGCPLGRIAAIQIGRIASPHSVAAWIDLARRSTVRDLRVAIAQARAAGADSPLSGHPQSDIDPSIEVDLSSEGNSPQVTRPFDRDTRVNGNRAGGTPPGVDLSASTDDLTERSLVRVPVPQAIRAAFDEALELYRAVEGSEASLTSFAEALVAECSSGEVPRETPPDTDRAPLTPGPSLALIETALARSTAGWSHLPSTSGLSPALALAEDSLASLQAVSRRAGTGESADLLAQMRSLVSLENEIEVRLGRLLAEMAEDGALVTASLCRHRALRRGAPWDVPHHRRGSRPGISSPASIFPPARFLRKRPPQPRRRIDCRPHPRPVPRRDPKR